MCEVNTIVQTNEFNEEEKLLLADIASEEVDDELPLGTFDACKKLLKSYDAIELKFMMISGFQLVDVQNFREGKTADRVWENMAANMNVDLYKGF